MQKVSALNKDVLLSTSLKVEEKSWAHRIYNEKVTACWPDIELKPGDQITFSLKIKRKGKDEKKNNSKRK